MLGGFLELSSCLEEDTHALALFLHTAAWYLQLFHVWVFYFQQCFNVL